ncbi:Ig domain-containing protein [Jeotgalibaca ciconiae]|uniref:Ig domain-containing protein n=1 Tax=Jeotgalibaca ciconiae TaxID=2496265 RepID=A0A3S9HC48_9LACT|nr:Ig domain-containing protein [Jeotgalibaca ciconiae]AZP04950.1 Ig domain-containing protein [Jeotgalibaca ciconiae]
MKKIWRVFFASTLLLSTISPTVVTAAENIETTQNVVTEDDRTPIIDVSSLSISKKVATAGDELKLSIKIENSAYVGLVRVIYWDPGTQFFKILYLNRNINTGKHETTIKITENTFPGEYVVREINTTNANGIITASYHYKDSTFGNPTDLSAANYTVVQTVPDTTGPTIDGNSLQLSPSDGTPGTSIGFSLNAHDESGVQEVIAHYLNPVTNAEEMIPFTYNETSTLFEGAFDVTSDTAAGEWRLTKITATDTLGNASEWENTTEPAFGAFTITQPVPDTTGPVINGSSLQLSTADGTPGTTIGFSLDVQDESGVKEVIAHYLNPVTKEEEVIPFTFNETTALFEGIFEVTGDTAAGEWILTKISAKDELDNASELDNSADPTNGAFKVTQPDTTGPEIDWESLTLSAKEVVEGDRLIIDLNINDFSDIKTATLAYRVPSSSNLHLLNLVKNAKTGRFEAALAITKETAIGEWNLDSIMAKDKAANVTTIYNSKFHTGTNTFDLSKGQFKVLDKKGEITRPVLSYSTYIQGSGWQKSVAEGGMSGTEGESKRLEAIKINLSDSDLAGTIHYRTHVEKNGWMDWVENGQIGGTKDESKRLEAIEIKLTDELAATYDIYYRAHTQKFGWLDWAKNGDPAGTAGLGYRLEAIEVRLVEKGKPAPGKTNVAFWDKETQVGPGVHYSTYIQKDGWQNYHTNGQLSGTTGQAKHLGALKIQLKDLPYKGGVEYQAHVQNDGWLNSVSDGEMSGTHGESKRMEAIRIKLTGEIAKHYDIYYRVHVQNLGWLDWAKNGESAGSEGLALRLEGIEVIAVKKNDQVPDKTQRPFVLNNVGVSYTAHVQKSGWQNPVFNGILSGTTGKALRLEGIKLNIQTDALSGGIQYRAHIQDAGWQNWKENGQLSGTEDKSLRMEAIQINLTGEMAQLYDVYYRVHVQDYGWMDWTKNGQPAGTEGHAKRLEGIQVRLVLKGKPAPGSTDRPFVKK